MSDDRSIQDFFDDIAYSVAVADREALDALPYEPSEPRGRVHKNVTGSRSQSDLMRGWVSAVPAKRREATLRFLAHLLASTPAALRHEDSPSRYAGHVPLYSKFIEEHFRGADWKTLEGSGLLGVRPYSRAWRRSREFRVPPDLWREFLEAGSCGAGGPAPGARVDLATGRTTTRRVKSDRTTETRNALPPLVRAAIDAVGPSPFNPGSIRAHVERLRARADAAPAGSAEAVAAHGRYLTDLACCKAVFDQGARPLAIPLAIPLAGASRGELWEYRPAYRMQSTGRIGQKGGGLQSCSRAMKEAAYVGVPDLVNLDLKSSQARILITLMEEAGIEPTWLRRYGDRPDGKHEAAGYVGVDVDTWKECLYAALMGAHVANERQAVYSKGTVKEGILRDVGADAFEATYGRFLRLTADLHDELGRWHEHLITAFVAEHGRRHKAKTYLTNGVGASATVEDLAVEGERHRLKARLAAFLLQGREAAFTHALTASSAAYGFRVISHEHDGVVVVGAVPPEAVEAAADAARLPLDLVDLVSKPFS